MSSTSSTSLDGLSNLTATARAPVLVEACAGRAGVATKPCLARPTLLTLSVALGMVSFDADAAETFRKLTGGQIAGILGHAVHRRGALARGL
jgi:hypothetical protein